MRMFTSYANGDDTALAAALHAVPPSEFLLPDAGDGSLPTINPSLTIDTAHPRQRIDGFGASLTQASAALISRLPAATRRAVMTELFSVRDGIGISMLRQPIGPSDHVTGPYRFTRRRADPRLESLDFSPESRMIIPLLTQAQSIRAHSRLADPAADSLNIIASSWSAPAWMKTNRCILGKRPFTQMTGYLRPSMYAAYAEYLARFITHYRDAGLHVFGVTPTNEPDYPQSRWPSMAMTPAHQARFIADFLAPCLRAHGLGDVRVLCWDHNYSTDHYPDGRFVRELYAWPRALRAVAGSAWHYYGGASRTMSDIHRIWPDKGIWVTEASGGDWGPRNWDAALVQTSARVIAMLNNWAQSVVLWNIALDGRGGPDYYYLRHDHRHSSNRGLLTIDARTRTITRNADYYVLAHCSRFVQPGSVVLEHRLEHADGLHAVAFRTADGSIAAVVTNEHSSPTKLRIGSATVQLPPRSLTTLTDLQDAIRTP
ncbi:glycoside hydrolase family 30 protein [Bifidobacterium anseris]|nr:glycoside hydrolase family 30 beta sandwich domain-containing protein [Bifidobacterium anseris]